jgi:predicted ATPase/class 3 adenylate cyclase
MSELRALLLTDVVDSTKLAQAIGDAAMAEVWSAHDRVARDLLPQHRGREIDKTDGMLMLFERAADAVDFALAYHAALARLPTPLSARAGLHVGPVLLRENSAADVALGAKPLEVEGLAKPTAARIMALARGGQTLLTAEAREALGPTELKVVSHGHWTVKGVTEPIEVFEVGDAARRFVPPEDADKAFRVVRANDWWLPVRDIPNNLPHQATSFVGREDELDEVKALLEKCRLLTLLGMGGLGKTRLATQAAAALLHRFPDGVWFVDLSPLREPELVAAEALQVTGVNADPGRTPLESLCSHLRTRHALLVLDNCEHLIAPAAALAAALLKAAPYVRLIATSREALRVPGEQSFPLKPLPLPQRDASVAELGASPAVRLFCERARQIKPGFELDTRQAGAIADLVAQLEGIPLALELAAARVRSLSVADINARLKDRYKILTGGARVLQERQQTLRALVDWSYDLLTPHEQRLFMRLGAFVGGFDLAAAEAVCGEPPLAPDDVLDLLASLADKSLLALDESHDTARYRMLETIRVYAQERLAESGEADAVATRHCEHYFAFAKQARAGILGTEQGEWLQRLELDLDNVRAAIALSLAGRVDSFIAVKMAVALHGFWLLRGYASEGRGIVRSALALPAIQASDLAHAWALYVGGGLAESQSDHTEAKRLFETCLVLRRRLGNPVDIAAALSTLSLARLQGGDAAGAEADETEALALFRESGDRRGEAIGLLHLGQIRMYTEDYPAARDFLEQGLAVSQALHHQETEAEFQLLLGALALCTGDTAGAELWLKRSLTVCREAADRRGEANAQRWLARCDLAHGDHAGTRTRLGEALRAFMAFEMWEETLGAVDDGAQLAAAEGDAVLATRLLAASQQARDRLQLARAPQPQRRHEATVAQLQGRLGPADFAAQWQAGLAWEVRDAVAHALAEPAERAVAA